MAITQSTQVLVINSITDVQGPDGLRYKQISGTLTPDVGTTKIHFNGSGGFFNGAGSGGAGITFYMKATGAGTLPVVGDSINVVAG